MKRIWGLNKSIHIGILLIAHRSVGQKKKREKVKSLTFGTKIGKPQRTISYLLPFVSSLPFLCDTSADPAARHRDPAARHRAQTNVTRHRSSLNPFTPKLTSWWKLRACRTNQPPPFHHLTSFSARGYARESVITWQKCGWPKEHVASTALSASG